MQKAFVSLVACLCAANLTLTLAAQPTSSFQLPTLRPISFPEFRRAVLNGEEIKGRVIPPMYIVRALEEAPEWQKQSPKVWMKLRSCRITCRRIKPQKPSQAITQYRAETQNHMTGRYPDLKEAVYLSLPVDLTDVEVRSDLLLDNAVIQGSLTFVNVDFLGSVSFQGAVFESTAIFQNVNFHSHSDFSGVLISKNITFEECRFTRQAAFSKSVIPAQAKIYFSGDKLEVPLDFSDSTFRGKLTLEGTAQTFQVAGKVYLNGINRSLGDPQGELRIKNAEFKDGVYLDESKWGVLDFAESEQGFHRPIRFLGFCDLRQSVFLVADLAGVEFDGYGELTGTEFRELVSFERSKLRKPLRLRWEQIDGKLGSPARGRLKLGSLSETDKQSYEELERDFHDLGDLHSENECRFQRRLFTEGRNWEWAFFGFEVHPLNPFVSMLPVLLLFTGINALLFKLEVFSGGRELRAPRPLALTMHIAAVWQRTFPVVYGTTTFGRVIFWIEFWCVRVLWFAFVLAWMNKSPLLKELLPYLK